MIRRSLFAFLLLTLFTINSNAQRFLGVATCNFNRTSSMYLNPANLVDDGQMFCVHLRSYNIRVDHTLGTSGIASISRGLNNSNSDSTDRSTSIFTNSGKKNFSMILPELTVHGPGIAVSIGPKHSVAVTTGIRVMNQFNNFDQSLYNTITNTAGVTSQNYSFISRKFNWTAHMWNEIALSYAGVVLDNGGNQLKVGVTLRRLGGVGYISLKGNNFDVNYFSDADSFYASHSDLEFASNVINDSTAVFNGINAANLFSKFFGATAGTGIGGDIGVVYKREQEHDLVFSAAVTDLGAIKYTRKKSAIINIKGNGSITGDGLSDNSGDATAFENYMKQQGFSIDTSSAAAKVHMPTTLIIGADYQVNERFYVNALFISNLANRQNFGNSYYNQITLTPRYDTRLLSVALPITYSALAHDMKLGVGIRFSGFFIGSDDMLALFSNHQYGAGVYLGGFVPIKARG